MKSFLDNLICAPSGGNDKMKPDQERVKTLLTDTVTLLCKNGLQYSKELKVQGLLGITLDNDDVFVVHINEIFNGLLGAKVSSVKADESSTSAIAAADSATSDVVLKSRKGIPHKYESNSSAVGSSKRKSHTPSPIIKRESQSEDEIVIMDSKSLDSGEFDDLGEGDREAMRKSYGEMLDQPPTKRRVPDSSGAFREKQSSSFLSGLVADTKEKLAETDMADDQDESSLDDATGLENMTADGQTVFDNSAGCSAWDGTGNPPTQGDTQDSTMLQFMAVNYCRAAYTAIPGPCSTSVYVEPVPDEDGNVAYNYTMKELEREEREEEEEEYEDDSTEPKDLSSRSSRRSSSGRRRNGNPNDRPFICGYPGCELRFYFKKNMLRHQTYKHGRVKTK